MPIAMSFFFYVSSQFCSDLCVYNPHLSPRFDIRDIYVMFYQFVYIVLCVDLCGSSFFLIRMHILSKSAVPFGETPSFFTMVKYHPLSTVALSPFTPNSYPSLTTFWKGEERGTLLFYIVESLEIF